jgi:[ribosomal protein S5]-alanine N-acetyltransferase
MPRILTRRLELISATAENLRAELAGPQALAASLCCDVPATWPPKFYDADAIQYTLDWMQKHPGDADWGFYYIVRRSAASDRPLLIGAGGFKGGPDKLGAVEIGYSIVANQQRQGFATEAVEAWLVFAFGSPRVTTVTAQTLPSLAASIRVLEKTGFRFVGAGLDADAPAGEQVILFEISRTDFANRASGSIATSASKSDTDDFLIRGSINSKC